MSDFVGIEMAKDSMNNAKDELVDSAVFLSRIGILESTVTEIKTTIGDLCICSRLLSDQLVGLKEAGLDNIPK